jgi:hypothetical protein
MISVSPAKIPYFGNLSVPMVPLVKGHHYQPSLHVTRPRSFSFIFGEDGQRKWLQVLALASTPMEKEDYIDKMCTGVVKVF